MPNATASATGERSRGSASSGTNPNNGWGAFGGWWQSTKYGCVNVVRYLIIAGLFLFLLTMVILLNDIMAFHDRVASEVGDDARARRVVLMLHRIHENPELYPSAEQQLPIGTLAVKLGQLQATGEELARFRDVEDKQPTQMDPNNVQENVRALAVKPGGLQAAGTDPAQSRDVEDKQPRNIAQDKVQENVEQERVTQLLKQLEEQSEDLRDTVMGTVSEAAVDDALIIFERNLLEDPVDSVAQLRGAVAKAYPQVLTTSALARLRQRFDDLNPDRLSNFIGTLDLIQEDVEQLKKSTKSLESNEILRDQLDQLDREIERMRQEITSNDQGAVETRTNIIGSSIERLDKIIRTEVNPLAIELAATFTKLNNRIHSIREIDSTNVIFEEELQMLKTDAESIQVALENRYPEDYPLAREMVERIHDLRAHVDSLNGTGPSTYVAQDGIVLDENDDVEDLFRTQIASLNEGLASIEKSLGERSRVIALADVIEEDANETPESATVKAAGILQDFDALNRFSTVLMPFSAWAPDWPIAQFGVPPQRTATLTTDSIATIYIFMIGAIGSLIYITKYQLKMAIEGHWLTSRPTRPMPWLLFRPFFGVVVAFAVYLLVRAGQLAFGTNGGGEVGTDLNIPILSVVALFAGLLSWQALGVIESRGQAWFSSRTRRPLWATGLDQALRTSDKEIADCAYQIGRSQEQVERWLLFRDKVPVELQDRIATWLEKQIDELFSEDKPADQIGGKPMWAVGLKAALDNPRKRLDPDALVELLREEKRSENLERVKKWIDLKWQVSPVMQWRLVDLLDVPHRKLFAAEIHLDIWGLYLRRAIEDRKENAQMVADRLGLDVAEVHAWKELDKPVPSDVQERLKTVLDRGFSNLFEPGAREVDWFRPATDLAGALGRRRLTREAFADQVDVEVARVDRWIDKREPIAPDTRETIKRVLGDDPFEPLRLPHRPDDGPDGSTESDQRSGAKAQSGGTTAPEPEAAATEQAASDAAGEVEEAIEEVSQEVTAATEQTSEAAGAMQESLTEAQTAALTVGGINVAEQLTEVVQNMEMSLEGITDAASAEAALSTLTDINTELEGLSSTVDQLPEDAKKVLADCLSGRVAQLKITAESVMSQEGVADVLQPVLEPIMVTLNSWAQ